MLCASSVAAQLNGKALGTFRASNSSMEDIYTETKDTCENQLLQGDKSMRTDVVVIGGGAVGAAVAYFLKLLETATLVSVVERDPTYSQASTPRGSGGVRRLFSLPENIELSKVSMAFFDSFAETRALDGVKADIGLKKNGYLFIVPPSARQAVKRNSHTQ